MFVVFLPLVIFYNFTNLRIKSEEQNGNDPANVHKYMNIISHKGAFKLVFVIRKCRNNSV